MFNADLFVTIAMFLLADEQWKCRRICACAVGGVEHLWSFGLINKDFNVPPCSVKVFISIVLGMFEVGCMCPAFSRSENCVAQNCLEDPKAIPPQHFKNSLNLYRKIIPKSGHFLEYAGPIVQDDYGLVHMAVHSCPRMFEFVGTRFRDDVELATIGVFNNPSLFEYASTRLQNDPDFVMKTIFDNDWISDVTKNQIAKNFGPILCDNLEFMTKIVAKIPTVFECASSRLRDNAELAMLGTKYCRSMLNFVSERLRSDFEFVKRYVERGFSDHRVFMLLKCNKEIALMAVKQDGSALAYLQEFSNDFDVCMEAVKQNGSAVCFTSLRNPEIVYMAVSEYGMAIEWIKEYDRDLALVAVKQNGMAFSVLQDKFKNDPEIINAAVSECGMVIQCIEEYDWELALTAVRRNGMAFRVLQDKFKNDYTIARAAVNQDPSVYKFIPVHLDIPKPDYDSGSEDDY